MTGATSAREPTGPLAGELCADEVVAATGSGPLEEALRGGEQEGKGEQEHGATSGSSLGSQVDQEVELQEAGAEEQQGQQPERIIPREG